MEVIPGDSIRWVFKHWDDYEEENSHVLFDVYRKNDIQQTIWK